MFAVSSALTALLLIACEAQKHQTRTRYKEKVGASRRPVLIFNLVVTYSWSVKGKFAVAPPWIISVLCQLERAVCKIMQNTQKGKFTWLEAKCLKQDQRHIWLLSPLWKYWCKPITIRLLWLSQTAIFFFFFYLYPPSPEIVASQIFVCPLCLQEIVLILVSFISILEFYSQDEMGKGKVNTVSEASIIIVVVVIVNQAVKGSGSNTGSNCGYTEGLSGVNM